jgi:predicted NAD/FAD-dependent oxidoreductase
LDASTAIVGAGLAGLSAAHELADAGFDVRLFDKARAPAGRTATRRAAVGRFDHGAQYFTVRDPRVVDRLAAWQEAAVVAPWEGPFHTLERGVIGPDPRPSERWVGTPTMSALARHLSAGLDVVTETRIESIERDERGWRLSAENGSVYEAFERVLVATPAPQAVPLLAARPELGRAAGHAAFEPCHAVMVTFAERPDVGFGGAFVQDSPLAWIADESSKPGRADAPSFVLHASPAWSRENCDAPPDRVVEQLLDALAEALDRELPAVLLAAAHRWLYALPSRTLDRPCLWEPASGFGVCGDWLHGARIESAVLSGLALSEAVRAQPD